MIDPNGIQLKRMTTPLITALQLLKAMKGPTPAPEVQDKVDEVISVLTRPGNVHSVETDSLLQTSDEETHSYITREFTQKDGNSERNEKRGTKGKQSSDYLTVDTLDHRRHAFTVPSKSRALSSQSSRPVPQPEVKPKLMYIDPTDLNGHYFDSFKWAIRCQAHGGPLLQVGMNIFRQYTFMENLNIPHDKLANFLFNIGRGYHKNPYHNEAHAVDVLQMVHLMITTCSLADKLSDIQIMSVLIAAAIHDYNHPGISNAFLIATRAPLAITYNDMSVLEAHHVAEAYRLILQEPSCNFLCNFSKENFNLIRETIITTVLATDMKSHFPMIAEVQAKLAAEQDIPPELLLKLTLHAADISNPARPWTICQKWGISVMTEFYGQGKKEQVLQLPFSPFCNPDCDRVSNLQKCQTGFINIIVLPMFEVINEVFQSSMSATFVSTVCKNRENWTSEADAVTQIVTSDLSRVLTSDIMMDYEPTFLDEVLEIHEVYWKMEVGVQCEFKAPTNDVHIRDLEVQVQKGQQQVERLHTQLDEEKEKTRLAQIALHEERSTTRVQGSLLQTLQEQYSECQRTATALQSALNEERTIPKHSKDSHSQDRSTYNTNYGLERGMPPINYHHQSPSVVSSPSPAPTYKWDDPSLSLSKLEQYLLQSEEEVFSLRKVLDEEREGLRQAELYLQELQSAV